MTTNDRNNDRFEALLRHSIQTAPMEEPPPGFAQEMDRLVTARAEDAGIESWLTRIALWATAMATIGFAVPHLDRAVGYLLDLLGDVPWPLLLSVLAALGMVKLMEFVPLVARR